MDELVKIKCSKELIGRFIDKGTDFSNKKFFGTVRKFIMSGHCLSKARHSGIPISIAF